MDRQTIEKVGCLYNKDFEFYKVGITSTSIIKRFGSSSMVNLKHNLYYDVLYTKKGNFTDLFLEEQAILRKYHKNRIKVNYNKFSSYECFDNNIIDFNISFSNDINIIKKEYNLCLNEQILI